jgi:hypothetical protein
MFVSPDFMLSFQAVLLTTGIVTVPYFWLRKLCSPKVRLLLTFTGAFGTMLWPYAYISLETKLLFFLLLAGSWGLPVEAYVGGRGCCYSLLLAVLLSPSNPQASFCSPRSRVRSALIATRRYSRCW